VSFKQIQPWNYIFIVPRIIAVGRKRKSLDSDMEEDSPGRKRKSRDSDLEEEVSDDSMSSNEEL
jgi:hypothetical protein